MVIDMNDEQLRALADVRGFLDETVTMDFAVAAEERYAFMARTVKRFGYGRLKRPDKAGLSGHPNQYGLTSRDQQFESITYQPRNHQFTFSTKVDIGIVDLDNAGRSQFVVSGEICRKMTFRIVMTNMDIPGVQIQQIDL
ncbi:MAG: hypothetical protein A3H93_18860 [Rhodocyclales bacterium RIFCSPLOWO2_02_FULL_63_24]|nr:MAG: hypothetical protein A3H93_18860 [Rhodocyclales bacterium RIFCSPLOWO2_02_FULL_63_24]